MNYDELVEAVKALQAKTDTPSEYSRGYRDAEWDRWRTQLEKELIAFKKLFEDWKTGFSTSITNLHTMVDNLESEQWNREMVLPRLAHIEKVLKRMQSK
jgi:hypothetical protein